MTPLGECLVFYLKYPAETEHVPDQDPSALSVADAARVVEMARAVRERSAEEAADFLQRAAGLVQDHFQGFCTVGGPNGRAAIRRNWWVSLSLYIDADATQSLGLVGLSIREDIAAIVPWLYVNGGRKAEERAAAALGDLIYARPGTGLVYDRGSLALAKIPMLPAEHTGFDVDAEPLLAEVSRCVGRLGPPEWRKLIDALS